MGQIHSKQTGSTASETSANYSASSETKATHQVPGKTSIPPTATDHSREVLSAVFQTQEQERKRISEDLHHSVGQLLYATKLKLSKLDPQTMSASNAATIHEIQHLLDETLETTRKISFELMPSVLQQYGVKIALEELCKKFSGPDLSIDADIQLASRHTVPLETSIFRIVQELINNIIKHSSASKASIKVFQKNKFINIIVEDNGKGFTANPVSGPFNGMGLNTIRNRAFLMDGTFQIFSTPEEGTRAQLKLKSHD